MARIKIEDLPVQRDMTPEEAEAIAGAGRFIPRLEGLESREMFATGITQVPLLSEGTMRVLGTTGQDQITLGVSAGHLTVNNVLYQQFDNTTLKQVLISSYGGGDVINLTNFPWSQVDVIIDEGSTVRDTITTTNNVAPVLDLQSNALVQMLPTGNKTLVSGITSSVVLDNGDIGMLLNQATPGSPGNCNVALWDNAGQQLVNLPGGAAAVTKGLNDSLWLVSANNTVTAWNKATSTFQPIPTASLSTVANQGELFAWVPRTATTPAYALERSVDSTRNSNGSTWVPAPTLISGAESWILGVKDSTGSQNLYHWDTSFTLVDVTSSVTLVNGDMGFLLMNQATPGSSGNYNVMFWDNAGSKMATLPGGAAAVTQGLNSTLWLVSANNTVTAWNKATSTLQPILTASLSTVFNQGELFAWVPRTATTPAYALECRVSKGDWVPAPTMISGSEAWILGFKNSTTGSRNLYQWDTSFTQIDVNRSVLLGNGDMGFLLNQAIAGSPGNYNVLFWDDAGQQMATLPGGAAAVTKGPDGNTLWLVSANNTVTAWNKATSTLPTITSGSLSTVANQGELFAWVSQTATTPAYALERKVDSNRNSTGSTWVPAPTMISGSEAWILGVKDSTGSRNLYQWDTSFTLAADVNHSVLLGNGDMGFLLNQATPGSPGNYNVLFWDDAGQQMATLPGGAAAVTKGPDGNTLWLVSANNTVTAWNKATSTFQPITSASVSNVANQGELFAWVPQTATTPAYALERKVDTNGNSTGSTWVPAPTMISGVESWILGAVDNSTGCQNLYHWDTSFTLVDVTSSVTLVNGDRGFLLMNQATPGTSGNYNVMFWDNAGAKMATLPGGAAAVTQGLNSNLWLVSANNTVTAWNKATSTLQPILTVSLSTVANLGELFSWVPRTATTPAYALRRSGNSWVPAPTVITGAESWILGAVDSTGGAIYHWAANFTQVSGRALALVPGFGGVPWIIRADSTPTSPASSFCQWNGSDWTMQVDASRLVKGSVSGSYTEREYDANGLLTVATWHFSNSSGTAVQDVVWCRDTPANSSPFLGAANNFHVFQDNTLLSKWLQYRGQAGDLGLPLGDSKALANWPNTAATNVKMAVFQNGTIVHTVAQGSTPAGTYALNAAITSKWLDLYHDTAHPYGLPTNDAVAANVSGQPGWIGASFTATPIGASIGTSQAHLYAQVGSDKSGVFAVYGGIWTRWNLLGGPSSLLGMPTSDVTNAWVAGDAVTYFQNGAVYWNNYLGRACALDTAVLTAAQAYPGGLTAAGRPTQDSVVRSDGSEVGYFENVVLYFAPGFAGTPVFQQYLKPTDPIPAVGAYQS